MLFWLKLLKFAQVNEGDEGAEVGNRRLQLRLHVQAQEEEPKEHDPVEEFEEVPVAHLNEPFPPRFLLHRKIFQRMCPRP